MAGGGIKAGARIGETDAEHDVESRFNRVFRRDSILFALVT
jgi:hypothetical protein